MKLAKYRTILGILILAACVCAYTAQAKMNLMVVASSTAAAVTGNYYVSGDGDYDQSGASAGSIISGQMQCSVINVVAGTSITKLQVRINPHWITVPAATEVKIALYDGTSTGAALVAQQTYTISDIDSESWYPESSSTSGIISGTGNKTVCASIDQTSYGSYFAPYDSNTNGTYVSSIAHSSFPPSTLPAQSNWPSHCMGFRAYAE